MVYNKRSDLFKRLLRPTTAVRIIKQLYVRSVSKEHLSEQMEDTVRKEFIHEIILPPFCLQNAVVSLLCVITVLHTHG
jgi:hypothetical protein